MVFPLLKSIYPFIPGKNPVKREEKTKSIIDKI